VRLCQSAKASDARDKVYGLLGVLPLSITTRIEVNYDSSCKIQDVFTSFTKAYLEADGNLCSMARVSKRSSLIPNLPSWAFDLEIEQDISETTLHKVRTRTHQANLNMMATKFSFSNNNRILYCEGAFMDTVSSLGSVHVYEPRLGMTLESESKSTSEEEDAQNKNFDWPLALARVLIQDSTYNFSNAPSVLDIPWLESSEIDEDAVPDNIPLFGFSEKSRQWSAFYRTTPLANIFHDSLLKNGDLEIGNKPLREYFSSKDTICSDTTAFVNLAQDLAAGLSGNRLMKTRGGLLGTVPRHTDIGDIIAVLAACDMPMVLRPNGKHYEVLGSCFVEGLMHGESAIAIAQGCVKMQEISLC
jgi:hypothetical protein